MIMLLLASVGSATLLALHLRRNRPAMRRIGGRT